MTLTDNLDLVSKERSYYREYTCEIQKHYNYHSKVMANVKVFFFNRKREKQTNRKTNTDREGKNYAPIYQYRGIKRYVQDLPKLYMA